MLRSWHNNRSYQPAWGNFSIVLAISTEPYMLIENLNQSPFNVGIVISPGDFTYEQIMELNARYDRPLSDTEAGDLVEMVGGHPYLVQQAFYQLVSGKRSLRELIDGATDDDSPFVDHLMHYLFLLSEDQDLRQAMFQVVSGGKLSSAGLAHRLQSAGLVKVQDGTVVPRCKLYADYFVNRLRIS
jgi:hypothetical protein